MLNLSYHNGNPYNSLHLSGGGATLAESSKDSQEEAQREEILLKLHSTVEEIVKSTRRPEAVERRLFSLLNFIIEVVQENKQTSVRDILYNIGDGVYKSDTAVNNDITTLENMTKLTRLEMNIEQTLLSAKMKGPIELEDTDFTNKVKPLPGNCGEQQILLNKNCNGLLLLETEGMLMSLVQEEYDDKTIILVLKGNPVIELRKLISNINAALSSLPHPTYVGLAADCGAGGKRIHHLLKYGCEQRFYNSTVNRITWLGLKQSQVKRNY